MNIFSNDMRLLRTALSQRQIDVSCLLSDPSFNDNVNAKAEALYSKGRDQRTLDQVTFDVTLGELGEYAIVNQLNACGIQTYHNVEQETLEFYWDVLVQGEHGLLKGEIKCQSDNIFDNTPKRYFSFSSSAKDELMRQKWQSLDFVIAYTVQFSPTQTLVCPWLLIDPSALNPQLNLYPKSIYNNGHYLRMDDSQNYFYYRWSLQ